MCDEPTDIQFTPRAEQVLKLAERESQRLNHNFIGTEHLLLGTIKLGQGVACTVLKSLGLDLETVRMGVEKQVGTGPAEHEGKIPYTPRSKKVLALAKKEAAALKHTYVGTEHILLGILRENDGVAARVLKELEVDLETTRQQVLKELDPNSQPKEPMTVTSDTLIPGPSYLNFLELDLALGAMPKGIAVQFVDLQLAVLKEIGTPTPASKLLNSRTGTAGVLKVVAATSELSIVEAAGPALTVLNGGAQNAAHFVREVFAASPVGSPSEQNLGALIQLLTGESTLSRTIQRDHLAALRKAAAEES